MAIVEKVQQCLSKWDHGGSVQCRSLVDAPHSNPSDPESTDILTSVYQTLITSTLKSWNVPKGLAVDALIAFVQSVLERLPSSSLSTARSPQALAFEEILVDIIWYIDTEIEELFSDSKTTANVKSDAPAPAVDKATAERWLHIKQNAETDKATVVVILKRLLALGVLNLDVCRERFDVGLLVNMGVVTDRAAFERKEVRMRTSLFYKQYKFNLLREQSEGYSKLVTEITSCLGPSHSPATGYPTESHAAIEARARPVWERIMGLIGYFDLDPNRVLDIILDVFSTNLATHYSFFLTFLSLTSWASRPERPSHTDEETMAVEPDSERFRGKSLDEVWSIAENPSGVATHPSLELTEKNPSDTPSKDSKSEQKTSNIRVLPQILGFKFAHYQLPEISEPTPRSLYLMAALLIRDGFMTLEELCPHLSPTEDEMGKVHADYLKKVKDRIAAAKISLLAMAAPLESAGSTTKTKSVDTPESKKPEPKEVPNQKCELVNALLSLGAFRQAFAILSKFPWIVDASPEIADLVLRVLKHSLAPLYESTSPVSFKPSSTSFTQPRARYGSTGIVAPPERRPQLTLWAPTPPSTSTVDFVFFYPDWSQRVPVCSTLDDLVDVIEPIMRFIGLHVSRDPAYLTKFLRLGRAHMNSTVTLDPETKKPIGTPDPDHPIRLFWYKVLRLYLLPALPLIRGNAVCTVEVWNIIRQYETTLRWQLYGEWKDGIYKSHPELQVRQVQVDREAKGVLRRLSHNTIDSLSGTVAKLAHSNPCIFFSNAVYQIMAYDNLAGVVIQALNYVTIMGFDVLIFIVLDAMANPNRERVKMDGVNTSDWLQSLASFTGMLFRRYSADLTPLLKYIVHSLYGGQTSEIIVLRELIWRMAGIEPLPSLSDSQIAAMAGGPTLRIEAVASTTRGSRLDPGDAVLKGPQRLGKTLLESNLALPLLIQVAQQRQTCVFQAANAQLKSLAHLYDTTHGVLFQYLDLLTTPSVISPEEYAEKIVPSLTDLNKKFGVCLPICMHVIRPIWNGKLLVAALAMEEKERLASEEAEKRLKAALTAKREPSATTRIASPSIVDSTSNSEVATEGKNSQADPQGNDEPMEIQSEGTNAAQTAPEDPWLPELSPFITEVKELAPGNAAEILGPAFYLTFWQLSTYDLSPPAARYEEECTNLRNLSRQEDAKYTAADRSSDRTKRQTAYLHRDKRNRYNTIINQLSQELKEQTAARRFTIKRLAREKQHWFSHHPKGVALATAFVEHCLHPRCLLSPMDADYCAQIIKVIHMQGTPVFYTLMVYDKILGDYLRNMIFSCSEYEARNYGRFLLSVLSDLAKWHNDEQAYLQDNRTKSGGKIVYFPGFQKRWTPRTTVPFEDILRWADYKQVVKKWHRKLGRSIADCLDSGEFMHMYNAILIAKEVLPVFPVATVHEGMGLIIMESLEKIVNKETRGDLKILSKAYQAGLQRWETRWMPMDKSTDKGRRANPPASAPTPSAASDTRTKANASVVPSAPRAQLATANGNASPHPQAERQSSKTAMESVPRPEVVKRVRTEAKPAEVNRSISEVKEPPKSDAMVVDQPAQRPEKTTPSAPQGMRNPPVSEAQPQVQANGGLPPASALELLRIAQDSRPNTPNQPPNGRATNRELPKSPRVGTPAEQKPMSTQAMPPPSNPSQTTSAQELRETAKQGRTTQETTDERPGQTQTETRVPPTAPAASVPSPSARRRSVSPASQPGTRNPSAESRASGGRRSNRGDSDRPEEKRVERDGRQEARESSRRDTHGRGERDKDRERSSRAIRESERDKDGERDRERGRDRHGERERPRERERDRGDRDRDRDRERDKDHTRERDRDRDRDRGDRERDRDRDRDRDRHRRDEKDRDRDSRKEREASGRGGTTTVTTGIPPVDERGLPNRPEAPRHRDGEETLGKRWRGTDDEPARSSKRVSRKDGHHEERSSRRPGDKEGRERARDERRRKDRDQADSESKSLSVDTKLGDKRIPEGPASASKTLPPNTPSAPRAMAASDTSRLSRADSVSNRDQWKQRDAPPHAVANGGSAPASDTPGGSLRARIGEKEAPARGLPQAPSSYRASEDPSKQQDSAARDEDRDGARKRTLSERDKDSGELPANPNDANGAQPSKRPRINRNRYNTAPNHGLAKKLLPIDPSAEKTRGSRNGG